MSFGNADFTEKGILYKEKLYDYSNFKTISYYNVAKYINGMPIRQDFEIKINLSQERLKFVEKVDITTPAMKIPISKLLNATYRKQRKQEQVEKVNETHERFAYILTLLHHMTGISPEEKIPYF